MLLAAGPVGPRARARLPRIGRVGKSSCADTGAQRQSLRPLGVPPYASNAADMMDGMLDGRSLLVD